MPDESDMDLVREYARGNSEQAFAELVHRHITLVYSVALRFTRNSADAEDVVQAVFVILARKAGGLRAGTILTGWLYETTRLTALQLLRNQARHRHHEQEASMQSTGNYPDTDAVWPQFEPLLERAMSRLNWKDRTLLALRFYENRSGAEAAAIMGIGEWAARKRVERALKRLRGYFAKYGVNSTEAAIAELISANSMRTVPMALAKTVTVVASAKGAATSASTLALINGALKIMAWTKARTSIVIAAGILLAAGTGVPIVENHFFPEEPSYQGRSLSEWLPDLGNTHYYRPPEKAVRAAEAIRKMGAKTLPFLLADLGDSRYKRYLREADKGTSNERIGQAIWAFDALGVIGKPAIPELTRILKQHPSSVPGALAGIGRDALPELLEALTNADFVVRDNTAAFLANAIFEGKITPAEAEPAFPIAVKNLAYTNANLFFQENTRSRAASLLEALQLNPDESVPALVSCMERSMDESNYSVAAQCAQALGHFEDHEPPEIPCMIKSMEKLMDGPANLSSIACEIQFAMALGSFRKDARAAIPVLTTATNSTNAVLSLIAAQSLKSIE